MWERWANCPHTKADGEGRVEDCITLLFVMMKEGLIVDHSLTAQSFTAGKVTLHLCQEAKTPMAAVADSFSPLDAVQDPSPGIGAARI